MTAALSTSATVPRAAVCSQASAISSRGSPAMRTEPSRCPLRRPGIRAVRFARRPKTRTMLARPRGLRPCVPSELSGCSVTVWPSEIPHRYSDVTQEAKLQRQTGEHSLGRCVLLRLDRFLHEQFGELHRCRDFDLHRVSGLENGHAACCQRGDKVDQDDHDEELRANGALVPQRVAKSAHRQR